MQLYNNDFVYLFLCLAVAALQLVWLKIPVGQNGRKRFLTDLVFCLCLAGTAASLMRLFPGNTAAPDRDSSAFLYIGQRMLEGKVPYRDLFDHKGPILYWIQAIGFAMAGGSLTGVWILELVNMAATLLILLRLCSLFSERKSSAYLALILVFAGCGWKIYQGGNFTEEYALPWISLALYVFYSFFRTGAYRKGQIVWLGTGFAVVFFLRANMIAVWAALMPVVVVMLVCGRRFRDLWQCVLLFLCGLLIVTVPVILYAACMGCLKEFAECYFLFNFRYTGDVSGALNDHLRLMWYFLVILWPGMIAVILSLLSRFRDSLQWINLWALIVTLITVQMSGRPYYHYDIVMLPVLVLPCCSVFDLSAKWLDREAKAEPGSSAVIAVSAAMLIAGIGYRMYSAEKNQMEQPIVTYLKNETTVDDDVLVLGNSAWCYLLSDRKTGNRFFYQTPPIEVSRELREAFEAELERVPSDVILVPLGEYADAVSGTAIQSVRVKLTDMGYSYEENESFGVYRR